ncbi:unnamed protein product [Ostreobium quekettii]|uniref:Uncharacterized protein n=1 Tax=Ostreobium quekettii TaxID=121088 RepID=A0A8S1IX63_9CHLO|nr:unnamed protein product [Ostreobium quekettii]
MARTRAPIEARLSGVVQVRAPTRLSGAQAVRMRMSEQRCELELSHKRSVDALEKGWKDKWEACEQDFRREIQQLRDEKAALENRLVAGASELERLNEELDRFKDMAEGSLQKEHQQLVDAEEERDSARELLSSMNQEIQEVLAALQEGDEHIKVGRDMWLKPKIIGMFVFSIYGRARSATE